MIDRGEFDAGLGGHLQTLAATLAWSEQSFFAAVGFEEAPDHLPVTMLVGSRASAGIASGATIAIEHAPRSATCSCASSPPQKGSTIHR